MCNKKYSRDEKLVDHIKRVHQRDTVDWVQVKEIPTKVQKERIKQDYQVAHVEAERERGCLLSRIRERPEECAICFVAPSGGAAVIPCGHAPFCAPCLTSWARDASQTCPMCRGAIERVLTLKL
jgi:hypothetical protein